MEKYSRGRRGAPAKGVGRIYPAREFKSLLLRQNKRASQQRCPFVLAGTGQSYSPQVASVRRVWVNFEQLAVERSETGSTISPSPPTKKELLVDKSSFFVYPLRKQWYIISHFWAGYHQYRQAVIVYHRPQAVYSFAMMIYNTSCW